MSKIKPVVLENSFCPLCKEPLEIDADYTRFDCGTTIYYGEVPTGKLKESKDCRFNRGLEMCCHCQRFPATVKLERDFKEDTFWCIMCYNNRLDIILGLL